MACKLGRAWKEACLDMARLRKTTIIIIWSRFDTGTDRIRRNANHSTATFGVEMTYFSIALLQI
jgi:hypothetical protein